MEDQLITFETAELAKVNGFDELTPNLYVVDTDVRTAKANNNGRTNSNYIERKDYKVYSRPTQSLLQKWLRETHNIDVVITPERYTDGVNYLVQAQKWDLTTDHASNPNFVIKGSYWFNDNGEYPTYETALEKGLIEALKLNKIKGNKTYRHTNNPLEKKLHDNFIKEHINDIEMICVDSDDGMKPNRYLTNDEKSIVISTVQWMGSPVGQSFLEENGFKLS